MTPPLIYLDTNHLSALARHPHATGASVRTMILTHEVRVAFSLFHLNELSAPSFKSRAAVGALLDHALLGWALRLDTLHDSETTAALGIALGGRAERVDAFFPSPTQAWDAPAAAAIAPSRMLEVFSDTPRLRAEFVRMATHGAELQKYFSTAAVVVTRPEEPLLARIRARPPLVSPTGLALPVPYPPEELLARAGGLVAFPSYHTFTALARTRSADGSFPADPNHILDDLHACYSPYADFTALDRTTRGRCWSANLPHKQRIFYRLDDLYTALRARAG